MFKKIDFTNNNYIYLNLINTVAIESGGVFNNLINESIIRVATNNP
jgi:hypothetical protein